MPLRSMTSSKALPMTSRFLRPSAALLAAAALFATGGAAWARNDASAQPVAVALGKSAARTASAGIVVRFGSASAQGADVVGEVHVEGKGDVGGGSHKHAQPSDDKICRRAFNDALAQLAAAAKAAGATAVVGIVSDYKGDEAHADGLAYECHSGSVHSFVDFKGVLTRTVPDDPAYPASGFARVDDSTALPLSDAGKARYQAFLAQPKPRAFVVYEDGSWYMSWGRSDAPQAALRHCAGEGKHCWLYAVDSQVVWSADVAKRFGDAQLLPGGAAAEDDNE
jgi:uncharacterized protein YbjQ (UPF0145 family)